MTFNRKDFLEVILSLQHFLLLLERTSFAVIWAQTHCMNTVFCSLFSLFWVFVFKRSFSYIHIHFHLSTIISINVAGPIKDINDQDLCDERKLYLDEWPWIGTALLFFKIARTKPEITSATKCLIFFCPYFDLFCYRSHISMSKHRNHSIQMMILIIVCSDVWSIHKHIQMNYI